MLVLEDFLNILSKYIHSNKSNLVSIVGHRHKISFYWMKANWVFTMQSPMERQSVFILRQNLDHIFRFTELTVTNVTLKILVQLEN